MPVGLGEATQMIGPIAPALMCWISLIVTVVSLALFFLWTNITAFARRARNGESKSAAGSVLERSNR